MGSSDEARARERPQSIPAPPIVLIIDDEVPIAEALAMIVEDAGYTPIVAFRGQDGVELARIQRPALVITDMMMPQMDGAAVMTTLRSDAATDGLHMPITVIMTAGGLERARTMRPDALLRKPFSIDEVEALLRRLLPTSPAAQDGKGGVSK